MEPLYKESKSIKNQLSFNFLTKNIQGLQSTKERLKNCLTF